MATSKYRLVVLDDYGEHVKAVYVDTLGKDFEGADLSGLTCSAQHALKGKCFRNAVLYWANLADSNLSGCDLRGADLRGAVLTRTNLKDADLRDARLGLDSLGGVTELSGADLRGVRIEGASFEGAVFDSATQFPDGFDPEKAGMRCADSN